MEEPEVFKDLVLKGFKVFNGLYRIGNHGTLIAKRRPFTRVYPNGNVVENMTEERTHVPRCSKKSPLLFSELYAIVTDKKGKKTKILKTVYIHKLVAEHFLERPKDKGKDKVAHIDPSQPKNNFYKNLMWVDWSFLSKRSMVLYPHNRDNLKKANIRDGYYEFLKQAGPPHRHKK